MFSDKIMNGIEYALAHVPSTHSWLILLIRVASEFDYSNW